MILALALLAAAPQSEVPVDEAAPCRPGETCAALDAAQMFALAERQLAEGRPDVAETLLRALTGDPDVDTRSEARFRLAQLLMARGDHGAAVELLSALLAEKPDAQPVRLELARALALQGDLAGAARQLRRAQSGGLPPDVQQLVDRFAAALRTDRPWGGSFEVAIAPDTNINQATAAPTIDLFGLPLVLDEDARATSGLGLNLAGQAYFRADIGPVRVLTRAAAFGNFYERSAFNDIGAGLTIGPEFRTGAVRLRPAAALSRRWFGGETYLSSAGANLQILSPLGRRGQIEAELGGADASYRIPEQSGPQYTASVGYERALSPRTYGRLSVNASRLDAEAPAYAMTSFGGSAVVSRDFGRLTGYASLGYSRSEADGPFPLFGAARDDDRYDVGAGLSWKRVRIAGLSPIVRVTHTVNRSALPIYQFTRTRVQLGLTERF